VTGSGYGLYEVPTASESTEMLLQEAQTSAAAVGTWKYLQQHAHKSRVPTTGSINCTASAFGGDPAPAFVKACYCRSTQPGTLDCTTPKVRGENGGIDKCPDGKVLPCISPRPLALPPSVCEVNENGFYLHWMESNAHAHGLHGGCLSWSVRGSTPFYSTCINIGTAGNEYVCGKLMAGHPNYAATNIGFLLGKRVHCKRPSKSSAWTCSVYKVGLCIQGSSPAFSNNDNANIAALTTETANWAKAAVVHIKNGQLPEKYKCKKSTTNARFQTVDDATFVRNFMSMA
jgi:hypothetical protein